MIGYAGRITPWKGLKEIAECCYELGYKVKFMGHQDKVDYWNTISEEAKSVIDFEYMDCTDAERLDYYRSLTCYVGNSEDGLEEGTLEYLEAMACGVPVITTPSGIARELAVNDENCLLVPFNDKDALKVAIKRMVEDKELRQKCREKAWEVVNPRIVTGKQIGRAHV